MMQDLGEEPLRPLAAGGEEFLGRAVLDDLALVHEDDPVSDLRAKPISWVTQTMVMPSLASSTMTSSTSLIISGSSAEVGSSNIIAIGSMASARAIATRCCWPPDSWVGYFGA